MKYIDAFLNGITMYRLVMYGLGVLALLSVALGFAGVFSYSGFAYLASLLLLVLLCYALDFGLSTLYREPLNGESAVISALILFFILEPSFSFSGLVWIALGGIIAILSKYILAYKNKHLFNPAAFGALVLSTLGSGVVLWWVATPLLALPVLIFGLLVVRKIRRFDVLLAFVPVSIAVSLGYTLYYGDSVVDALRMLLVSWPIIFFGTIMLTEPSTLPPTRGSRLVYGALTGVLFSAHFSFGPLYASPQFALIVGNIFSYVVSPKRKLLLTLSAVRDMGAGFYEFVFTGDAPYSFRAGQYLEWTVPPNGSDGRGNRRYLSISSGPGESDIRFATRMPKERPSSFKRMLLAMKPGQTITAGNLAGDFTLPSSRGGKYLFIAGGIGITPFISMLRELVRTNISRDIVLVYATNTPDDVVFKEVLSASGAHGVRVVFVAGRRVDEEVLKQEVPDFLERVAYISGPNVMVEACRSLLRRMRVPGSRIRVDYFPGL